MLPDSASNWFSAPLLSTRSHFWPACFFCSCWSLDSQFLSPDLFSISTGSTTKSANVYLLGARHQVGWASVFLKISESTPLPQKSWALLCRLVTEIKTEFIHHRFLQRQALLLLPNFHTLHLADWYDCLRSKSVILSSIAPSHAIALLGLISH